LAPEFQRKPHALSEEDGDRPAGERTNRDAMHARNRDRDHDSDKYSFTVPSVKKTIFNKFAAATRV
jgi:hypothetical protein